MRTLPILRLSLSIDQNAARYTAPQSTPGRGIGSISYEPRIRLNYGECLMLVDDSLQLGHTLPLQCGVTSAG